MARGPSWHCNAQQPKMVLDDPFQKQFQLELLSRADWREIFHMSETEETSILRDLVGPDVHRECNGDNKDERLFKCSSKGKLPTFEITNK